MPVILATQEAEIRRIMVRSQLGLIVCETLSQKNPSPKKKRKEKRGLVDWLKMKVLSSSPGTTTTTTTKEN
jgi:hypothetical protein